VGRMLSVANKMIRSLRQRPSLNILSTSFTSSSYLSTSSSPPPPSPTTENSSSIPSLPSHRAIAGLSSQYFTYLIESTTPFIGSILKLKLRNITPGVGSLVLKCRPELNENQHFLHGGAMVGAIDHAAGFCAWSLVDSHTKIVSTINLEISYFESLNIDSEG
jgi:hypothetical protein